MAHSGLETDENDNSPQPIATLSSNSLFLWFSTSTIVALMEEIVGLTIYESQNTSDTKQSSTVRVLNCSAVKEHIISCLKLPLFWFKAKAYLFCPQFLKSGIEGGSRGQRKKITSGVSLTLPVTQTPKGWISSWWLQSAPMLKCSAALAVKSLCQMNEKEPTFSNDKVAFLTC